MSETAKKVLLVGHCGPDTFMLRNTVQRFVPGAEVENVTTEERLKALLEGADLLLVNRVLDGRFEVGMGVELIESIQRERGGRPATILISNYPDAQRAAEQAGALPGFGKNDLYDPATGEKLKAALVAAEAG